MPSPTAPTVAAPLPPWMSRARLVLTFIGAILFFGPFLRDANASHLLNPTWPGHARLHFMWAIAFMVGSGVVNLYYLWRRPPDLAVLRLCALWQATSLLGGFWTAVVLADLYGGTIRDPEHHIEILGVNENILVFGTLAVLLVAVSARLVRPPAEASTR